MALVRLHDVPTWRGPDERDPDDAGPVGTRALWPQDHSATLVGMEDGYVMYQREVPMAVYAAEVRELPTAVAERLRMLSRMHAWLFLASGVEIDSQGTPPYTVSFSALPHSQNRFFRTRLRRLSHRSTAEVNRLLLATLAEAAGSPDPEEHLQEALDRLPFVPFQAANRRRPALGAWMVYSSRSDLLGPSRFDWHRNYTIGVCRDPDGCRGLLREDPIVQEHLKATQDGTLFLDLPSKGSGSKGPIARPLSPTAVEKSPMAMELAIDLALAGPASRRIPAASSRVARQVVLIYRDILLRWTKRDSKRYPTIDDFDEQTWNPDEVGQLDEEERVERVRLELEVRGEAAALEGLSRGVTDLEPGDEEMVRLILACPNDWPLPPSLVRYLEMSLPLLDGGSSLCPRIRRRLTPG